MVKNDEKDNIRRVNTAAVLDALRRIDSEISRPELAEKVGLSKVTIASIIRSLKEEGLTSDAGLGLPDYRGGRKPLLVALDKESKRVISARLAHNEVVMLLSDITGRELGRLRSSEAASDPASLAAMVKSLAAGAGIGQDSILGLVVVAASKPEALPFDSAAAGLARSLENLLGISAWTVSLAAARAFGERWYNCAADDPADFFYLDLGYSLEAITSRLGAPSRRLPGFGALCLGGMPYDESNVPAPTAETALCGREFLGEAAELLGGEVPIRELTSLAEEGEPRVLELFRRYGFRLGCALAMVVNLTSLERIIIGGFMTDAWPHFKNSLQQSLTAHLHPEFRSQTSVSPIREDLDDGLMGGLALALDKWVYKTNLLARNDEREDE